LIAFFIANILPVIQTLEEYLNTHASAKIHSLKEVQFPFNFKGMPDFAPVVSKSYSLRKV